MNISKATFYFSTERPLQPPVSPGTIVRFVKIGTRTAYFFRSDRVIPEYDTQTLLLLPKQDGELWHADNSEPLFCYVVDGQELLKMEALSAADISGKILDWGGISNAETAQKWTTW
ncbi:hypothetical protein [Kaistia defluvii]|uniref:Uncharacterized protein n=1 Tax=Kaistia defluvii TaxID=410841 RepID=A0ABV2QW89_9HYPH